MIFQSKIDRAFALMREKNANRRKKNAPDVYPDAPDVPRPELSQEMEKGDLFAMIVAAFAVLWPIVLIVLVVLALAGYFFIVR